MRKEHDFLGELEVADELYYGVQTIRALEKLQYYRQTFGPRLYQSISDG